MPCTGTHSPYGGSHVRTGQGDRPGRPLPAEARAHSSASQTAARAEIDAARADIGRRPADQRVIWTVEGPLTRRVNGIPSDVPVASHEVKAVRFIVRPSALSVPWVV